MTGKYFLVPFLISIIFLCGIKNFEIPENICEGIDFGYLSHPDPQRCTEYIVCLRGEYHLFVCAYPGYIFYLLVRHCVRGSVHSHSV